MRHANAQNSGAIRLGLLDHRRQRENARRRTYKYLRRVRCLVHRGFPLLSPSVLQDDSVMSMPNEHALRSEPNLMLTLADEFSKVRDAWTLCLHRSYAFD